MKGNPCKGVRKFTSRPRTVYISDEQYAAIYHEATPALCVAMEISYLCAARLGDVLDLRWDEVMDSFAKYTIIDWIAFLQVLLIWFYMAYRSGQWIVSVACSKGWRWWNRKNKKALALDSFYEAFNLNSLQPGSVVVVTTQSGMTIQIHKPKVEK